MKHVFLTLIICFFVVPSHAQEKASEPIKIGDMHSYTLSPAQVQGIWDGMDLAAKEINENGGVLGRRLEIFHRDDKHEAGEAVRIAEEYVNRDQVFMLTGAGSDSTGPAVSDFSQRYKVPFMKIWGGAGKMVWENGHRYLFRYGHTTETIAALYANQAAKLPAKRWAFIAPEHLYGHTMTNSFAEELKKRRPDVEVVEKLYYQWGKLPAGEFIQIIDRHEFDALFVQAWDADLMKLVRQGSTRGFFEEKEIIADWIGLRTILDLLGKEMPEGWQGCGFPTDPGENKKLAVFGEKIRNVYNVEPDRTHLEGYLMVKLIAKGLENAGQVDREAFIEALRETQIDSPMGKIGINPIDQQVRLGCWFGETAVRNSKGVFINTKRIKVDPYFPPDEWICEQRPDCKLKELEK